MTDARASQVPVEVLRTNTSPTADVSQILVEVIRPNSIEGFITAQSGSFAVTGIDAALELSLIFISETASFNLTGNDANLNYGLPQTTSGASLLIGI